MCKSMKKVYIQPAFEATTVKTIYSVLTESNPFEMGGAGKDINGDIIEPV